MPACGRLIAAETRESLCQRWLRQNSSLKERALQPSEEQRSIECIDQQFRICSPLQLARRHSLSDKAALHLPPWHHIPLPKRTSEFRVIVDAGEQTRHDGTIAGGEELSHIHHIAPEACQRRATARNGENRFHVFKARVEQDLFFRVPPAVQRGTAHAGRLRYLVRTDSIKTLVFEQFVSSD